MTAAFVETSAGAKRYLAEPGAIDVRSITEPVLCELTRVEMVSALWRKTTTGQITPTQAERLVREFEADWFGDGVQGPAFTLSTVDAARLDSAAGLVIRHGLRSGDAIQLACALAARDADPDLTTFACFDTRLRQAAAREGFRLLPAEL